MKQKEKEHKFRITIQQITIAGLMLALITIFKLVDRVFPKTPVGSSWVELYMVFAVIMTLMIPFPIAFLVLLISPIIWFITGNTIQTSPVSFLFDYSLPVLSVLVVYLARFFSIEKTKFLGISWRQIMIVIFIMIGFVVKWLCHTISGVISYQVNLPTSAIANAPFTFITMGVAILIVIPFLPKINELQQFVNLKGLGW